MNIAFLSSLDPHDIHSWSGTLFFMYQSLETSHHVTWIGGDLYQQVASYHAQNEGSDIPYAPEDYSRVFGAILSERFQRECYDIIVCRDYFFLADLITEIPVIYLGDTTFRLFNEYLGITDAYTINRNERLECRAIEKATRIVYPSVWAKQSAVDHYDKEEKCVAIIEFGANLVVAPSISYPRKPSSGGCHLLFVGTNWHMKGGDKMLSIYYKLQEMGINTYVTVVGCHPPLSLSSDPHIQVYPRLDKAIEEDRVQLDHLFRESDFLIAPTLFDCFGIVNSEAAAYGIPTLTTNTGGVSQAVREGENGFLFQPEASVEEWALRIAQLHTDSLAYGQISQQALATYRDRLNWERWGDQMNSLMESMGQAPDVYIPVYAINVKEREDRRKHIYAEFEGKHEFAFHLVEACTDPDGRRGLWNSIVKIVQMAKDEEEDVIIICEDDHYFTKQYSPKLLIAKIQQSYQLGADLLSGGIGGFGMATPMGFRLYQVDWFWCTQFIVVYASLYDRILSYNFEDDDTADGVLSELASCKLVIHPFISEQKDFGYSDVTQSNQEHAGRIREHFAWANRKFDTLRATLEIK